MSEDLGAAPVWVINNGMKYEHFVCLFDWFSSVLSKVPCLISAILTIVGISHQDEVETSMVFPFVQVCFLLYFLLYENKCIIVTKKMELR